MTRWRDRAVERLELRFGARKAMADQRERDEGAERITVMADYGCSGLWRGRVGGPVDPDDLGLSGPLSARVWSWSAQYQDGLAGVDFDDWDAEGRAIAAAVQEELGARARVYYRDI